MSDHSEHSVTLLIQGLRGPRHVSDPAAEKIWNRYFGSLFRLASQQLSPKVQVRRDPEDVVLDVFATFFMRIQRGEFQWVDDRRDLMRLLVAITVNKVFVAARGQRAGKRNVNMELPQSTRGDDSSGPSLEAEAIDARPEDAAILHELCERAMDLLDEQHREVAVLNMKGLRTVEIAARLNLSERSINRKVENILKVWSEKGIIDPFDDEP